LRARFPEEMTIVLQHQFWDLDVSEEGFSVTLSFQKQLERLVVPLAAVRSFADPSVKFELIFAMPEGMAPAAGLPTPIAAPAKAEKAAAEKTTAEVVALDSFRKR